MVRFMVVPHRRQVWRRPTLPTSLAFGEVGLSDSPRLAIFWDICSWIFGKTIWKTGMNTRKSSPWDFLGEIRTHTQMSSVFGCPQWGTGCSLDYKYRTIQYHSYMYICMWYVCVYIYIHTHSIHIIHMAKRLWSIQVPCRRFYQHIKSPLLAFVMSHQHRSFVEPVTIPEKL